MLEIMHQNAIVNLRIVKVIIRYVIFVVKKWFMVPMKALKDKEKVDVHEMLIIFNKNLVMVLKK